MWNEHKEYEKTNVRNEYIYKEHLLYNEKERSTINTDIVFDPRQLFDPYKHFIDPRHPRQPPQNFDTRHFFFGPGGNFINPRHPRQNMTHTTHATHAARIIVIIFLPFLHCVKCVWIQNISVLYCPLFPLRTEIYQHLFSNLYIQSEYGKIKNRKRSSCNVTPSSVFLDI